MRRRHEKSPHLNTTTQAAEHDGLLVHTHDNNPSRASHSIRSPGHTHAIEETEK